MAGTPGPKRLISEYLVHGSGDELIWQNTRIANAPQSLLWVGAPALEKDPLLATTFHDDMLQQASATASAYATYTSMDDGGTGTNAFQDVAGGWYNVVTAAANDDYHGIRTTAKPWLFVAGKELWFEARFKVSEGQTNLSTWAVGLSDTTTTGMLQTGNSGPLTSYSGACIYKLGATLFAKLQTSNAGTQASSATIATVVTNQTIRAGFYFDGTATTGVIYPFVDIGDGNGWVVGAAVNITLASLAQMFLFATIKAGGSGATAETIQIDYLKVTQLR